MPSPNQNNHNEVRLTHEEFTVCRAATSPEKPEGVSSELEKTEADNQLLGELYKRGLLSGQWHELIKAVSTQPPDLAAEIALVDGRKHFEYFSDLENGTLVTTMPDKSVHIRRDISMAALVGELTGPLNAYSCAPSFGFEVELGTNGFQVFCACIDFARLMFLSSTIQRQGLDEIVARDQDLANQVAEGGISTDNRWLITQFGNTYFEGALSADDLLTGITELGSENLIASINDEGSWLFLPPLVDIAYRLIFPVPGLTVWPGNRGKEKGLVNSISILGGWSLSRIAAHSVEGSNRFRLNGVDGLQVTTELLAILEGCCEPPRDESEVKSPPALPNPTSEEIPEA